MSILSRFRKSTNLPAEAQPGKGDHRPPALDSSLEPAIQRIGRELLAESRRHTGGFFSVKSWSEGLMSWAMKDPTFKVQLFRFIDAFPALTTPESVYAHLVDYLSQPGVTPPPGLALGLKAGEWLKGTLARTVSSQVTAMAERFIVGTDAASAVPQLRQLWDRGMAFSVDLLGEACVSDAEATAYRQRYLNLIETLPQHIADWPANPVLESDHLGPIPRTNVSIKISALSARLKPIDFEGSLERLIDSLSSLLQAAARNNVLISFDMEQFALKNLTLSLFERCCERFDFPAGLAIQAYLRSGDADADRIITWSKRTGRQVTVRLIKGAYWDYESVHAQEMGWPSPVWDRKADTDACFERMAGRFIDAMPTTRDGGGVKLAVGSHNARSIAAVLAMAEQRGLPPSAVEFQMLHGMADELKAALIERKLRSREYAPIGEMVPGMAYLVRRLLENTSNESWLCAGFADGVSDDALLAAPGDSCDTGFQPVQSSSALKRTPTGEESLSGSTSPARARAPVLRETIEAFANEPHHDFSDADTRRRFAAAVRSAHAPAIANDSTVVQADAAVARASAVVESWRTVKVHDRAKILITAAVELRRRRDELSGVMIREAGKTWAEADADACEAIDFCEFYARRATALMEPKRLGNFVGEINDHWHEPHGVAAVISPWNFPLAICCGMTVAALVTGNPVVMKPAEQTPGIARVLCEILWNSGVPRDVLQFIPGPGDIVGAALVRDPRIALIAFTGSKAVGFDILKAAAITAENQQQVKRVVCEMGGKNAIIVDESADLDEAVLGVRHSAFSYAGQKCSACSRVIAVGSAHDTFLRRLIEATRALQVGDPLDPGTDVGPVIDGDAAAKIRSYIEIGKTEAKLELPTDAGSEVLRRAGSKPLILPHIFSGVRLEHRIAREEIFGPVLAVMKADTFDQALTMANAVEYKLTGGVFSRTPSHLVRARREFRVGNLYLNRGITGALVGRQPFGGFGHSGQGHQAGSAEYLLQFVDSRVCTENALRRGFAPSEGSDIAG